MQSLNTYIINHGLLIQNLKPNLLPTLRQLSFRSGSMVLELQACTLVVERRAAPACPIVVNSGFNTQELSVVFQGSECDIMKSGQTSSKVPSGTPRFRNPCGVRSG
jgi:hypothetical protein